MTEQSGRPDMTGHAPGPHRARVRVWFGDHVIADYSAEVERAERYATAMSRRFAGLTITTEPVPDDEVAPTRPLPGERLWDVTPR
jgi:hypothetical protein